MEPALVMIGKSLLGLAVNYGVGTIVGNAIKATTPATMKTLAKGGIVIGGAFLSMYLGDKAGTYASKTVTEIEETIKSVKITEEPDNENVENMTDAGEA